MISVYVNNFNEVICSYLNYVLLKELCIYSLRYFSGTYWRNTTGTTYCSSATHTLQSQARKTGLLSFKLHTEFVEKHEKERTTKSELDSLSS